MSVHNLVAVIVVTFGSISFVAADTGQVNDPEPIPLAPVSRDAEPAASTTRYGFEVAAVDLASLVAGGGLSGLDGRLGGTVFLGGYLLGGPAVHMHHGNWGRAGVSLALRAGLPIATAAGFYQLDCGSSDCETWLPIFGGLLVGGLTASLIDWIVIAKDVPEARPERRLTPSVSVGRDGNVSLGIAGSFY
jgi:hypothetical protein